jgi:REP element-mobilizing transposase RayT
MKYFIPLESGKFYHIFNQAVGSEKLFRNDENYIYFLKKFNEYITPIASTFSYVLIPNHFHFLIEIKDRKELYESYRILESKKELPKVKPETELDFEKFVMQQFSNFFNCYTKSFNKKHNRKGALFIDYLRRTLISDEEYLRNIVLYIHQNPIHHKMYNRLEDSKYSSYNSILSEKPTLLEREEVINWFGDLENFIFMHTTKNIEYSFTQTP